MPIRFRSRKLIPFVLLGMLVLSIVGGVSFVRAAPPNLVVSIDDQTTSAAPGRRLTYRITVRNSSDTETLTSIEARDILPPANVATFVNVKNGSLAADKLSVLCAIADLAPGEEDFCYVTLDIKNPLPSGTTEIVNTAQVRANSDPDAVSVSDTDQVTNLPPTARNDATPVNEDGSVVIDVLANDSDPNSHSLSVQLVDAPQYGSAAVVAGNAVSYAPSQDYNGTDTFTYLVLDGQGGQSAPATVTITVVPVNDAPQFTRGEDVTVAEDSGAYSQSWTTDFRPGPVTATDEAGQSLTFTATAANPALFSVQPTIMNGTLMFTPAANANGSTLVTVALKDNGGTANGGDDTADSQSFTITITPGNDAPTAQDDTFTTNEDVPLMIAVADLVANDGDIDGDELTAINPDNATNGTITQNADGSFTFTPALHFVGAASFTYTASDGALNSEPATVTITVNEVNDAPVAVEDQYTVGEDATLNITAPGVLGNDLDADDDELIAAKVTDPAQGTLTLNSDGSFSYTPNANYFGTDSFTYTASDASLTSQPATVTITIDPANDAPSIDDQGFDLAENSAAGTVVGSVVAGDIDADPLTYRIVSGNTGATFAVDAATGAITVNNNALLDYETTPTWTLNVEVSDGELSDTANITINLTNANDAPTAQDDSYEMDEGDTLVVNNDPVPGVLANDQDVDEDELTAILVQNVTNGTLTLNSNGSFTYTPNANYFGTDSFTYKANDGAADSNIATVTITIYPINDPPMVQDDAYDVNEDAVLNVDAPGVLANDTDPENDVLTTMLVQDVTNGTLTLNSDGSFSYTPNANYFGTDSFTYTAIDRIPLRSGKTRPALAEPTQTEATVTITVHPVNETPSFTKGNDVTVAEDSGNYSQPWAINLSAGGDETGQQFSFTVDNNTNPTLFSTQPTIDPDGTLNFGPGPDKNGSATITVTLHDDGGTPTDPSDDAASAPQNFVITVTPVNDAPTATDDPRYSLNEDVTRTIAAPGVLVNDLDTDGDSLTTTLVTGTTKGSLTFNNDGSFSYTPNADYFGTDSFTYRVADPSGATDTATVTLTINAVNDAPSFTRGSDVIVDEDAGTYSQAWATNLSTGPANESGQTVAFQVSATNATLFAGGPTISSAGTLAFTPATNKNGASTVTVTLKDSGGTANGGVDTSAEVTFTITINAVNDAPIANDDTATTPKNTELLITSDMLLGNDVEVDGDELTITAITQPTSGSAVLNADGSITFMPANGFAGSATFTYTVSDGQESSDTATVTINVTQSTLYQSFLPLMWGTPDGSAPTAPDLVGSIRLTPSKTSFSAGEPVTVEVTVTNQGTAAAQGFWVDLYLNPEQAPTAPNVRWSDVCSLTPCYGLAWYVTAPLAPGQSVTLTSSATSYAAGQSIWPGWFAAGTSDVYLFVDSWNPGVITGAISESNETNNRAELHDLAVTGNNRSTADLPEVTSIPSRPSRLSQ